jgi:SAM-dependent methyltransferase
VSVKTGFREALSTIGSADRAREQARHDHENVYLRLRSRLAHRLGGPLPAGSRVLDLGCGYRYPNVALFHADGIDVSGADVEPVFFRDGRLATFRERRREKGLLRGISHAGPRFSECRSYYSELSRLAGVELEHGALSLHTYDGQRLPFADGTFTAVCSNAVLEHVEDLPAFVAELDRVLVPGGLVDMLWHNFYCPSGGHRLGSDEVASPWGHITGESPAPCFLNMKKPEEIEAVFGKRLTVLRVIGAGRDHSLEGEAGFEPEGAGLLDQQWRSRLPGLSDRLLTTRAFLIEAVKNG